MNEYKFQAIEALDLFRIEKRLSKLEMIKKNDMRYLSRQMTTDDDSYRA